MNQSTSTIDVWRIEHPDTGFGLFRHNCVAQNHNHKFIKFISESAQLNPHPVQDGLWSRLDDSIFFMDWYFGCTSINVLASWVTRQDHFETVEFIDSIKSSGYKLMHYVVAAEDCRIGQSGKQVMFYKDRAACPYKPVSQQCVSALHHHID